MINTQKGAGHVLNAENINRIIQSYESFGGRASPLGGQLPGTVLVEAFYPLERIKGIEGYDLIITHK